MRKQPRKKISRQKIRGRGNLTGLITFVSVLDIRPKRHEYAEALKNIEVSTGFSASRFLRDVSPHGVEC